jgi:hypothetical protein
MEGVLFIKFRSHLNELLPDTDRQLVLLNFSEIESIGITKQTQKSDARRGTKIQYFTFLDIHTDHTDLGPLTARLKYDIRAKAKTKYHAYAVSVNGKTIRIQWRSAQIRLTPGIGDIVANLGRKGINVRPTKHEQIDLRAKAVRNRKNQEADIIRMVLRGDKTGLCVWQKAYILSTSRAQRNSWTNWTEASRQTSSAQTASFEPLYEAMLDRELRSLIIS